VMLQVSIIPCCAAVWQSHAPECGVHS